MAIKRRCRRHLTIIGIASRQCELSTRNLSSLLYEMCILTPKFQKTTPGAKKNKTSFAGIDRKVKESKLIESKNKK